LIGKKKAEKKMDILSYREEKRKRNVYPTLTEKRRGKRVACPDIIKWQRREGGEGTLRTFLNRG